MNEFVVYGADITGERALRFFGKNRVRCFVDGKKFGKQFCGKDIISPEELKKIKDEVFVIIAALNCAGEIKKELAHLGISDFFEYRVDEDKYLPYIYYSPNHIILNYEQVLAMYEISMYKSIGIYGINNRYTPLLVKEIEILGMENKIKYIVCKDGKNKQYKGIPCISLKEAEEKVDCLIINTRRVDDAINDQLFDLDHTYEVVNLFDGTKCAKINTNNDIKVYHNIHKGKRCFFIGTGPSLSYEDLDKLYERKEICISCNKIFLAFKHTKWRPDYYIAQDDKVIKQNLEEIYQIEAKHKFIGDYVPEFWDSPKAEGFIKFHIVNEEYYPNYPGFSIDASSHVYEGYSVSYSALQLAAYLGFSEVYLIGCDSSDEKLEQHKFRPKHFDSNYVREGEVLNSNERDKMLLGHKKAEKVSYRLGIRIFNATRGGYLETYERVNLDDII